jgi:carbamoyltransferase
MRKIVKPRRDGLFELDISYFLHDKEGVDMVWEEGSPSIGRLFSDRFIEAFGQPREKDEPLTEKHQNIAASVQAMYEEVFFHILNSMHKKTDTNKLTLSGGCIQNSLANGKIFDKTPFTDVYISPASYDAGTAIGAAFTVWNIVQGNERLFVMDTPYWGPSYSDDQIENVLKNAGVPYQRLDTNEIGKRTAKEISNGKIVGWFQGRTEWGPRALGNRSILVDPRHKDMKDVLNQRIKRRESFRPFAPSILEDYIQDWFEKTYPVPFMEKVYLIKSDKRELIPAVTHLDGTGRLQSVSRAINPMYYELIDEFYKLTGVPIILNTSFNENEPIVNSPQDALNCFLRTKMDMLVIGNFCLMQNV